MNIKNMFYACFLACISMASFAETSGTRIYFPNTQIQIPKTLTLGGEEWTLKNKEENGDLLLAEYTTNGETINNWSKLFTLQFFKFELKKGVTPDMFADAEISPLKEQGYKVNYKKIKMGPQEGIIEFQVLEPESDQQDEIQKIIMSPENKLTVIHYVVKKQDMGDTERKKWIDALSNFDITTLSKPKAVESKTTVKETEPQE